MRGSEGGGRGGRPPPGQVLAWKRLLGAVVSSGPVGQRDGVAVTAPWVGPPQREESGECLVVGLDIVVYHRHNSYSTPRNGPRRMVSGCQPASPQDAPPLCTDGRVHRGPRGAVAAVRRLALRAQDPVRQPPLPLRGGGGAVRAPGRRGARRGRGARWPRRTSSAGSSRPFFGPDGHPITKAEADKLPRQQRDRCQWRRCCRAVTLSHTTAVYCARKRMSRSALLTRPRSFSP